MFFSFCHPSLLLAFLLEQKFCLGQQILWVDWEVVVFSVSVLIAEKYSHREIYKN